MQQARFSRWQIITLSTLTVGYAGFYLCRSNLSVATPLLMEAFKSENLDKAAIGSIASLGVGLYAIGKIVFGVTGDFIGGRTMFLLAMLASIAATFAFGLAGTVTALTIAWSFNRFVQAAGWGAAVKLLAAWFPPHTYGRAAGILALSYLFGDMLARQFLALLIGLKVSWSGLFIWSGCVLGSIALVSLFLLRRSPQDVGEPEAPDSTQTLVTGSDSTRAGSLVQLLVPLLTSARFWLVCIISLALTLIRETFNFWTPTYMKESLGMAGDAAAFWSSLFPFFGGLSVIATGFLTDRAVKAGRAGLMTLFLAPVPLGLVAMGYLSGVESRVPALILVSLVAFCMIGPYSLLSGAISLDFGGKRGSATAAGIIDAVGYLGGILSGRYIGKLVEEYAKKYASSGMADATARSWQAAFMLLAGIAAVAVVATAIAWRMELQTARAKSQAGA